MLYDAKRWGKTAATTFKTPHELRISKAEHAALIKVLAMLEHGEIPFGPIKGLLRSLDESPLTHFNMIWLSAKVECGTIGCIAGWARFVGNDVTLFRSLDKTEQLRALFLEADGNIQPSQAAAALRSYLTTGKTRWQT